MVFPTALDVTTEHNTLLKFEFQFYYQARLFNRYLCNLHYSYYFLHTSPPLCCMIFAALITVHLCGSHNSSTSNSFLTFDCLLLTILETVHESDHSQINPAKIFLHVQIPLSPHQFIFLPMQMNARCFHQPHHQKIKIIYNDHAFESDDLNTFYVA